MMIKNLLNFFLINILILNSGIINAGGIEKKKEKNEQNYIKFHKIDKAWKYSKGDNTIVAILDWCFDLSPKASKKYIHPTSVIPDQKIGTFKPWHGEWMAEIVHKIAPNAKIIPIRTMPDPIRRGGRLTNKHAYEKYLIKAILFAADKGAVAVTNSMGPVKSSKELDDAIDYANKKGTIFINVHPEYIKISEQGYIWCKRGQCNAKIIHSGLVSVYKYPVEPESNRDIYIWPYSIEPKFRDGWGYSNGPPIVAGVIALMKSLNPDLRPNEIKKIIIETAYMGDSFMILDAEAAIRETKKNITNQSSGCSKPHH
jgi:hypothetical protein